VPATTIAKDKIHAATRQTREKLWSYFHTDGIHEHHQEDIRYQPGRVNFQVINGEGAKRKQHANHQCARGRTQADALDRDPAQRITHGQA
jgi:hypothetical protein